MLQNQFPLQPSFDVAIFEIDPIKQMVNLTKIAKYFNKNIGHWLANQSTKDFLEALQENETDIGKTITVIQSGLEQQGTWGNQEVALEFAQWISPKFKVFCIKQLKELFNTGKTSLAPTVDFSDPNTILQLAQNWKDEQDKRLTAEAKVAEQQIKLLLQEPKVEYHDQVLQSESLVLTTVIAKELGWSAVRLNKKLVDLKIIFRAGESYVLHAKYQNKGYSKTKTHTYIDGEGKLGTNIMLVWTEKGREFIHTEIKKILRTC